MAKSTKTKSGKYRVQVFMGCDEQGKRLYHSKVLDTNRDRVQRITKLKESSKEL